MIEDVSDQRKKTVERSVDRVVLNKLRDKEIKKKTREEDRQTNSQMRQTGWFCNTRICNCYSIES